MTLKTFIRSISLILLATISFSAPCAHAKIEFVNNIRAAFKSAKAPTAAQLQAGATWYCKFFSTDESTIPSDSDYNAYFKFEVNDLAATNKIILATPDTARYATQLVDFIFDDSSMNAIDISYDRNWFMRATDKGDLILESIEGSGNVQNCGNAVSREPAKSCGYMICPVAKVVNPVKAKTK